MILKQEEFLWMRFFHTVQNIIQEYNTKVMNPTEKANKMKKTKDNKKNKKTQRKRRNQKKKKNQTQKERTKKVLQLKSLTVKTNENMINIV